MATSSLFAIALMYKDDYAKANLKMLPVVEPDGKRTNRQIIWHALLLVPVSLFRIHEQSRNYILLWCTFSWF